MPPASTPKLSVQLSSAYHLHSIKALVKHLRPMLELKETTDVRIDLSGLTFISPACIALLVAAIRRGRENKTIGDRSVIVHPDSKPVKNYLHRMGLLTIVFEKEEADVVDPVRKHEASGLKECEHFSSDAGGREVAKALSNALQEVVQTDKFAAASLELALIELTENVHYHADTPHGGFAAAGTFKNGREIEIAIVDLGVGIASSLRKNPDHAEESGDDLTAINAAIRPLVTATPERNSGYGLAFTRFLMEMNSGRLIVWSGNGWVQVGERHVEREVDPLPGTLVVLRLHTDRPFDFKQAYDQLMDAIREIEGPTDDDVRVLTNATS